MPTTPEIPHVLNKQIQWKNLYFFQKSDVIYQLSFVFCDRFIHLYKDRTRDQVIQAARSCKQNIVEGLSDGVTSTEMQLKLLNVARASLQELRQDFEDYLKSRHLKFWGRPPKLKEGETRTIPESYYDNDITHYTTMLNYCRTHNTLDEYEPFFQQWSEEELCNYGVTLCHMIDRMMMTFLEKLDQEFVTEGGIKERMYKARTGYRNGLDERLKQLEAERPQLTARITELEEQLTTAQQQLTTAQQQLTTAAQHLTQWQTAYNDLKQRALSAYYRQQDEITELKGRLGQQ